MPVIIMSALEGAGASLRDVVRTWVNLTNTKECKTSFEVRNEYFRDVRPVDTIMAIDGFVNPEWLVEYEAAAIISNWGN